MRRLVIDTYRSYQMQKLVQLQRVFAVIAFQATKVATCDTQSSR